MMSVVPAITLNSNSKARTSRLGPDAVSEQLPRAADLPDAPLVDITESTNPFNVPLLQQLNLQAGAMPRNC